MIFMGIESHFCLALFMFTSCEVKYTAGTLYMYVNMNTSKYEQKTYNLNGIHLLINSKPCDYFNHLNKILEQ